MNYDIPILTHNNISTTIQYVLGKGLEKVT